MLFVDLVIKIFKTKTQQQKIISAKTQIIKQFFQIIKACICIVKTVKKIQVTRFQKD